MNFRQARLPEDLEGKTIDSMVTGEIGYTTPWGMWVDKHRKCWLNPTYTVSENPEGTSRMRVELRSDGYHVWPPSGESWKPSSSFP